MTQSVYHIPVKAISGETVDLEQYKGKVSFKQENIRLVQKKQVIIVVV